IRFEKSAAFTWARHGDDADFIVGDEKSLWSDFFARENDQLLLHCSSARMAEREFTDTILRFHYNRVRVGSENFELDQLEGSRGLANESETGGVPIGRCDLNYARCSDAFLTWRAVRCDIFADARQVVGIRPMPVVVGRGACALRLPCCPYVAL